MLKVYGRQYTITMYINQFIHMTDRQLEYVLKYKGDNDGKRKKATKDIVL